MLAPLQRFYDSLGGITSVPAKVKKQVVEFFENNEKPAIKEDDQKAVDEQHIESARKKYASVVAQIREAIMIARTNGNSCILLKHGAFLDAVAGVVNEKNSGVLNVVIYGSYVKIIVAPYPRHQQS